MGNEFVLFGGAFVTLMLVLHMFTHMQGNKLLNRLLGGIFLLRFLSSLLIILIEKGFYTKHLYLVLFIESFAFLIPALLFLYFRSFLFDESSLRKKDFLHFIPFATAITFCFLVFLGGQQAIHLPAWIFQPKFGLFYLALGSLFFFLYSFYNLRFLLKEFRALRSKPNKVAIHWLYLVLFIIVMIHFTKLLFSMLVLLDWMSLQQLVNSNLLPFISGTGVTIFILYILRNPGVLYGNIIPRSLPMEPVVTTANNSDDAEQETPFTSGDMLDASQRDAYLHLIETHMKEELSFLDPSFSISDLSEKTGIPVHHCSYVLNHGLKKKFRDYINKYRIDHFIAEYPNRIGNETLEAIASSSGFKSSSTFYAAFKKETGTSPTSYFS
jgi:AraC-like DNA-binding protein